MPDMRAATSVAASMRPSGPGGVTMTISGTPATRAGMVDISATLGKGALAAGDVAGDRRDRPRPLAGEGAGADLVQPHLLGLLVLVEAADRVGGELHRLADLGLERLLGGVEVGGGGGDGVGLDRRLVELAGEAGERRVALGADRGDDRVDLGLEGGEVGLGAGEEAAALRPARAARGRGG